MSLDLIIEPLGGSHDRKTFSCGVQPLDHYFREQASQDVKRRVSNCFVAVDGKVSTVAGYYTLAASSVPVVSMPEDVTRRLPRYPVLPAILVGRLAVDTRYQGRQIGTSLIVDALRRSAQAAPASFALIVDAKDDKAAAFYRKHGFISFLNRPLSLFLPVATAMKLFSQ